MNGLILALCMEEDEDVPATNELLRPYFGIHRKDWSDGSTNFFLGYGDWIRLLHANDFEVEDLIELQAPPERDDDVSASSTPDWANQWPSEEVWKARKRG